MLRPQINKPLEDMAKQILKTESPAWWKIYIIVVTVVTLKMIGNLKSGFP